LKAPETSYSESEDLIDSSTLIIVRRLHLSKSKNSSNEITLVNKLLGSKAKLIHGQLVVKYIDYDTVKIGLYRKLHSGLPDVEFSVSDQDLPELLELLTEAKQKIDSYWLSKIDAT
jgi:hypothetical protein